MRLNLNVLYRSSRTGNREAGLYAILCFPIAPNDSSTIPQSHLYNNIMNILANKLCSSPLFLQLRYFASKMQASSTQKTKDSAGRRLGTCCLTPRYQKIRRRGGLPGRHPGPAAGVQMAQREQHHNRQRHDDPRQGGRPRTLPQGRVEKARVLLRGCDPGGTT